MHDYNCRKCGVKLATNPSFDLAKELKSDHEPWCMARNIKLIYELLWRWEQDRTGKKLAVEMTKR